MDLHALIQIVITLVILGFVLWGVRTYIPMDPVISNLISFVVALFVLLWLIRSLGWWGGHV